MNVYEYRDITKRINVAEKKFPGKGVEVALLEAVIEQNRLIEDCIKTIKKESNYNRLEAERRFRR